MSLFEDLKIQGIIEESVDNALVEHEASIPYQKSRAYFRGHLVRKLKKYTGLQAVLEGSDWGVCKIIEAVRERILIKDKIDIGDPFNNYAGLLWQIERDCRI